MVSRGVEGGILEGFEVGKDRVSLSQLQFADDTIFFCSRKEEYFLILNHIFAFFEVMSGLQINRGQCQVFEFNCCCLFCSML